MLALQCFDRTIGMALVGPFSRWRKNRTQSDPISSASCKRKLVDQFERCCTHALLISRKNSKQAARIDISIPCALGVINKTFEIKREHAGPTKGCVKKLVVSETFAVIDRRYLISRAKPRDGWRAAGCFADSENSSRELKSAFVSFSKPLRQSACARMRSISQ